MTKTKDQLHEEAISMFPPTHDYDAILAYGSYCFNKGYEAGVESEQIPDIDLSDLPKKRSRFRAVGVGEQNED
jgi:hypothetical protein